MTCSCPVQVYGPPLPMTCSGGTTMITFMTMLQTFINEQCDLVNPCDRVPPVTLLEEYDFIIVGSGAAGPVVANRLSENADWKVLLVEAGGEDPAISAVPSLLLALQFQNETDWNYKTEPQKVACQTLDEKRCLWSRGKVLGGCTTTNGMMYLRGHKKDFANWVAQGASNWTWEDVFPYFLKSEDNREIGTVVNSEYHKEGGLVTVQRFRYQSEFARSILEAGADLGYPVSDDLNGDEQIGLAVAQALNEDGERVNTARAFIRTAIHRPNLHVLLNAHVYKVLVDNDTKVITGIEFEHEDTIKTTNASKEVILSAGALNSPHLLLLSGIGPKETLEKFEIPVVLDLPGVGQNLHNHVGVNQNFVLNNMTAINDLNSNTFLEYANNRSGPMSSPGLAQVTALLNSKYADPAGDHPDVQLFFGGELASCGNGSVATETMEPLSIGSEVEGRARSFRNDKRMVAALNSKYADPAGDHPDVQLFFGGELASCGNGSVATETMEPLSIGITSVYIQPKSRGFVTLNSADPKDAPLLQPNYFQERSDMEGLIESAKLGRSFTNSTTMKRLGLTPVEEDDEACLSSGDIGSDAHYECLVRRRTDAQNHQAGSCKMGKEEDKMAVVDSELKVFGVTGLRVIDASVMPVVVTGNPMATIIMIGERGSDFIKKTWSDATSCL